MASPVIIRYAVNQFPSIRLFLVRHAQARNAPGTSYDDAPLSARGKAQAAAVARACAARAPDAIYTSPAIRARETVNQVGAAAGLPMTIDERLIEYRFGSISDPNLTMEQLRERRDDLLAWHPDRKLAPDGETIREFAERVMAVTDEIVTRHLGRRVVIVSHAGTIDVTMRWAIGISPGTPVLHDFPIANASISELIHWPHGRMTGGAPRYTEFVSVGSLDHLAAEIRSGN